MFTVKCWYAPFFLVLLRGTHTWSMSTYFRYILYNLSIEAASLICSHNHHITLITIKCFFYYSLIKLRHVIVARKSVSPQANRGTSHLYCINHLRVPVGSLDFKALIYHFRNTQERTWILTVGKDVHLSCSLKRFIILITPTWLTSVVQYFPWNFAF